MNKVIGFLIKQLANILLGDVVLQRIADRVEHWADFEISGAEKRNNVLADIEVIGLNLTESLANLGLELALQYIRAKA